MGCFTALKRCWRSSGRSDLSAPSPAGSPQDRRRASIDTPGPRSSRDSQGTPELPTQPSTGAPGAYSPESQEAGRQSEPEIIQSSREAREVAPEVPEGMWACPQCTFLNPVERSSCEMCRGSRPESEAAAPPLPIVETARSAEREARPPAPSRQKRSSPPQQKTMVTEDPAVLAQEEELDRSLDAARHQEIRLSILADDLEVDHNDLLAQLQQARERLAAIEQEEAEEEEHEAE